MIKNKKATMILFPVALFIMVALIFFYVNYNTKDKFQPVNPGYAQISILKTYQQAEKALLYIDLSAKYSAYRTIDNLKNKKGSFVNMGCNEALDESQESPSQEDCIPTKKEIYDAFSADFSLYLDGYLKKYKETELKQGEELIIPLDNYDLLVKEKRLIGIATENLKINKKNINYSIKPSFNIDIGFDLFEEYASYFKQESENEEEPKDESSGEVPEKFSTENMLDKWDSI